MGCLIYGTVLAGNAPDAAEIQQRTIEQKEGRLLDKIINRKGLRGVISEREAKRRIDALINKNPAIKSSIDDLVLHDPKGTLAEKRNRAIFAVYINNAVFAAAVDAELAR